MTAARTLYLKWHGPMSIPEALELKDEQVNYGIYQFYGPHPIYGPQVLLYIGKAAEQPFATRIAQEQEDLFSESELSAVYVSRVSGKSMRSAEEDVEDISAAEKLLIYAHIPAYNSQNIYSIPYEELQHIRVFNVGDRGSLAAEVSGERWSMFGKGVKPHISRS